MSLAYAGGVVHDVGLLYLIVYGLKRKADPSRSRMILQWALTFHCLVMAWPLLPALPRGVVQY
jgi:hypothetical protein